MKMVNSPYFKLLKQVKASNLRPSVVASACKLTTLGLVIGSASLQASAIFEDSATNVWLVDKETQAVTTFTSGQWVDAYGDLSGFPANAPYQVLVNGLPRSSEPMAPSQPPLSIIGLESADKTVSGGAVANVLSVAPDNGSFSETIAVVFALNTDVLESGARDLYWRINGGDWGSVTKSIDDPQSPNGSITHTLHLVRDGGYALEVELRDGATVIASTSRSYTLASDHPDSWRRDSDGDGIPDEIELEIGLDPLSADLGRDSDEDGWSDFDEWLRCNPNPTPCPDVPVDTDGDGWSDFDEELRGTRPDDLVLELPDGGEADERFLEQRLSLQERPSARRLYEVEYLPTGSMGANNVDTLTSASFDGNGLYGLGSLVSAATLAELGVQASDISDSRLLASAQESLEKRQWPALRLPASQALTVRAERALGPALDASITADLLFLPPLQDPEIKDFSSADAGEWADAEAWRSALIEWLRARLVIATTPVFDNDQTLALLALETMLREEARLDGFESTLRLGQPLASDQSNDWLRAIERDLREDGDSVTAWLNRLANALESGGILANVGAQLQDFRAAMPSNTWMISEWMDQRLQLEVDTETQGCFITQADLDEVQQDPDFFAQYQQRCPTYYTDADVLAWQTSSAQRRYALRLSWLKDGLAEAAASSELLNYDDDSDADSLTNAAEISLRPIRLHTLPWQSDSDGDRIADAVDTCPNDVTNACLPGSRDLVLQLEGQTNLALGTQAGVALLEVRLSGPADKAVTFSYSVEAGAQDSAVAGQDFVALSGTYTFQPGQSSLLIPVTLPATSNTGTTQFRLVVADVDGATVAGDGVALVQLQRSNADEPLIQLLASSLNVDERGFVEFDASQSQSGTDNANLSFSWQQISGDVIDLADSNTATPRFDAPELLNSAVYVYEVTATNSLGNQSSAQVSVQVNPVDDPPTVDGPLVYQVSPGDNLSILKADILAAVNEPDGEALSIVEVQNSPRVESFNELSDRFELSFASGVGGLSTQKIAEGVVEYEPWGSDGIAYRTSPGLVDINVTMNLWTPATGNTLIETRKGSFSTIKTDPAQRVLYYTRYDLDTSTDWVSWVNFENGLETNRDEVNTGGFQGLFGAQLNERNGNLYYCDNSWHVLDRLSDTYTDTGMSCDIYSAHSATLGDEFCITASTGLWCSSDDTNFTQRYELDPQSNVSIQRLSQGPNSIVLQIDAGGTKRLQALKVDGSSSSIFESNSDFSNAGYYWFGSRMVMQVPVKNIDNDEGVQVYEWTESDTQLRALGAPQLFVPDLGRINFGEWVYFDGKLVWLTQKALGIWARFAMDTSTGIYEQVGDDLTGERHIQAWGSDPQKLRLIESSVISESGCDWSSAERLSDYSSDLPVVLEDVECYRRITYGDLLVEKPVSDNSIFGTLDQQGAEDTSMVVRVEDENGNAVSVTITLDVMEVAP